MPTELDGVRRRYYYDIAERAVWTFIQSFAAVWLGPALLDGDGVNVWDYVTDTAVYQKAILAGIAAVVSLVKGLMAKNYGAPSTAATLPAYDDTPRG